MPEFAEREEDIREGVIDMAECKLIELMKDGNIAATIFFLKTQGKSRGYIESPAVFAVQRSLGDYKPGVDDPEEFISKALEAANA